MSFWFDQSKNRWRIRIRRDGLEFAETLPRGAGRTQAEERHALLVREHYGRTRLGRGGHTLAEALERLIREALPPRSAADVLGHIEALTPWVGNRLLTEAADVARAYRAEARKRSRKDGKPAGPLSAATINRRIAVLRRAVNLAWREWRWLDGPIAIPLARETPRHVYLTAAEVARLARACRHKVMRRMILIAAYTGMRWSEITGLTKASVHGDVVTLAVTKSGAPRQVPLVEPARRALRPLPLAGDRRWLYRHFKRAAAAIGRPELRFHDLRHTTASLLINRGVDLHTIGAILGHASAQTTKRYAHLSVDAARRALRRIAR
jgi:integrase